MSLSQKKNGTRRKAESESVPAERGTTHNLQGQRLGRKGQATREGILNAALRIIEAPGDVPLTMSGVAREVAVTMTTLYIYFPDLGELVLAVLDRVMHDADAAYLDRLRKKWPDETLGEHCLEFLRGHLVFWRQHARILQMRNGYADTGDVRFLNYRNRVTTPVIELLVRQMDARMDSVDMAEVHLATVLVIGFERMATVTTNPVFHVAARAQGVQDRAAYIDRLIETEADMMAVMIRRQRGMVGRRV
jgi:AcrR family transcriptional regulator